MGQKDFLLSKVFPSNREIKEGNNTCLDQPIPNFSVSPPYSITFLVNDKHYE